MRNLVTFLAVAVLAPCGAGATTLLDVPIVVHEEAGVARSAEVVTTGIPLPRDAAVTDAGQLKVVGPTGAEAPSQLTVMARWGGAPDDAGAPVRWLLVEFMADVPASSTATYRLQSGAPSRFLKRPLRVTSTAGGFEVDAGAARFVIDTAAFDVVHQVYLDTDADGVVDDPLLLAGTEGGAVLSAGGVTYSGRLGAVEEAIVERCGPLACVLRVKGWHAAPDGSRRLAYTARLRFRAVSGLVQVAYSVWNDNPMANNGGQPDIKAFGSPNTVVFDDLSVRFRLAGAKKRSYQLGGIPGERWPGTLASAASLYQDSSGGPQWSHAPDNVANSFRCFTAAADGTVLHSACADGAAAEACRALGWADLSASNAGLTVAMRNFWQDYPKAIDLAADGTVALGLFPGAHASSYELRVGERKTTDLVLDFRGAMKAAKVADRAVAYLAPLRAVAPAAWYLASGTFDHSVPYDATRFADLEGYNDAAISCPQANFFLVHEGLIDTGWPYSPRPEGWGWRSSGDTIAEDETNSDNWPVFTNQQYDHPFFFAYQYLRTLDAGGGRAGKWWELARLAARHQADVDIVHSRCTGKSEAEMVACMDPSTPPYPIGWAMGGRLTNQWHAWPSPDIHRHALIDAWSGGIRGMLTWWYLTGDPVVEDGWRQLALNVRWGVENTPCNTDPEQGCGPGYALARADLGDARDVAYNLEILTDAYDATGEEAYAAALAAFVPATNPAGMWFAADSFQLDQAAPLEGRSVAPFALSLVVKSLGRYLDADAVWRGGVDPAGRDSLLRFVGALSRWWQLGAAEPTQYYVYESGGYVPMWGDPMGVAEADGMAWALDYDDGRLDRSRLAAVAAEAFAHGCTPWGDGYARGTFMSSKTHAMLGIHGWRYPAYVLASGQSR